MAEEPKQYAIVAGSIAGGIGLMGPFEDPEEATREAEAWAADCQWWEVVPMEPPLDATAEHEALEAVAAVKAPQHPDDGWDD